jgi:hypothetical protein
MTGVADDLAFFGHHGMTTLGTGVKKLFGLVGVASLFDLLTEL